MRACWPFVTRSAHQKFKCTISDGLRDGMVSANTVRVLTNSCATRTIEEISSAHFVFALCAGSSEFIPATSVRLAARNWRSNGAQGPTAEPIDGAFPALPAVGPFGAFARGSLRQGDIIDARDTEQNWYVSTVLDTRNDGADVRVHFNGWSSEWDEWIPVTSERLAQRQSRSAGATGPDIAHDQAARSALAGAFPGSASKFGPSATSYAFDALMQPREPKPKPAPAAAAAASSSSSSFTFGEVPAGGFHFAPPPPLPDFDPFSPAFNAAPSLFPAVPTFGFGTATAAPQAPAAPVAPTSNPTGFAVLKKREAAAPMYVSASAMGPVSPAPSSLDAPSFVRSGQQSLLSRVMLARLVHATERSSFPSSSDRWKEGLEIVHRILTGETRPAPPAQIHPQHRTAVLLASSPLAAAATTVAGAAAATSSSSSSSSFEIVNAPSPAGGAAAPSTANVSVLPALSFFDSSRTTILQRLIQFYSLLDDRELRVGFMSYLPLIKARLMGTAPDSDNPAERPYDVDHADSLGRTTLHWIAMAPMTPRPGGFLFCLMELLLSLGANPSALTNSGESCMQLLIQNAQGSFELVAPLITLLRKHGAVLTETDEQGNTILHRLLSGSRISIGLLEDCILSALTGGFDLFATNAAGQTVFSLIRAQQSLRPNDPEIRLAHEMLGSFAEQWVWEIAPWLRKVLQESQGIDRDCAAIIEQYVSGSGRAWDISDSEGGSGGAAQAMAKPVKLKNWQDFAIGDLIDAFDTAQKVWR